MNKLPRSLRNNNPFNIKKSSSRWLGKVKGEDKVFESFDTMEHGVRAGIKLLLNYVKQGYNSPRKIIGRFAPSSENDTKSYLDFVSDSIFLPSDEVITNRFCFIVLCQRIIMYESGYNLARLCNIGITMPVLCDIFCKLNSKLF